MSGPERDALVADVVFLTACYRASRCASERKNYLRMIYIREQQLGGWS